MGGIEDINVKDIINTSAQSRNIYKVQPKYNRVLKILALYILKYLLKNILHEESDFLSIKSNNTILNYKLYRECDISILIKDPSKLLILNICNDMIYQICMKKMYKDGILLCSCDIADNSDLLLPFQYSIVDYDNREKSSILKSKRPSFINLKNLKYNILKSFKDKTVRDIDFSELNLCFKYNNDILIFPLKVFLYLTYKHIFHRFCIKKKLLFTVSNIYLFSDCRKNVKILE